MHARFRVRTREGRELTPGSLAAFARLLHDGEISDEDLIYDALTGEWAPARAHPVYFMIAQGASLEERPGLAPPGSPRPRPEVRTDEPLASDGEPPLGLADPQSSEAAAAVFVARMQAERESDPDRPVVLDGLRVVSGKVDGGTALFVSPGHVEPVQPPPLIASPLAGAAGAERVRSRTLAGAAGARPVQSRTLWMVTVLMCVSAGVAAPAIRKMAEVERADSGARPALSARSPHVSLDEADTRRRSRAASLKEARSLMDRLGVIAIPDVWLSGAYLANAVDFPEAQTAWRAYLELVRAQRASSEARYREAYLAELDAEGVGGALRSLRLAGAMREFRASEPGREAPLRRIEDLSVAALSLHDLLVRLTGSIRYEPARGGALSSDPVLEAAAVDAATQELLEDALDRVVSLMAADRGGPGASAAVFDWANSLVEGALTGHGTKQ